MRTTSPSRTTLTPPSPAATRRGRFRETALGALGSLLLTLGFAVSAQAAAATSTHRPPAGALKLPTSALKRVRGVVCGKVRGRWIPGEVVSSRYFLSDARHAQNYRTLARHARGTAKRKDLAQAKRYANRARQRQATCTRPVKQSKPPASPGRTPTPPTATPLRFDLSGAIGLALGGGSQSATTMHPAAVSHTAEPAAAAPAGPGTPVLQKLDSAGQIAPAISSGSAAISNFMIAPNGKVYVLFSTRVSLADTSKLDWQNGCLLAQVDPGSGVPTCVDNQLSYIDWGTMTGSSAPIQFDSTGAIYYSGHTSSGQSVLRRFDGSSTRDLITDNVSLMNFTVLPNGTVLVAGHTTSTGTSWTRRISPGGGVSTLASGTANWSSAFPDGNVYMGFLEQNGTLNSTGGWPVVARYLAGSDQMDTNWWIGDSTHSSQGGSQWLDSHPVCYPSGPDPVWNGFCPGAPTSVKWLYNAGDGHEYAVATSNGGATLVQLYPTLRILGTEVTRVGAVEGVKGNLVISGTNVESKNVLTLYNTTNDTERELIGPSSEIEIYHVHYIAGQNKILFDGLRFSDDRYVIGEYSLATNQLSTDATGSVKWTDLQAFG